MSSEQENDARAGAGRSPLMRYAGMGLELAASIVGLTLFGLWIDHQFETGPAGVAVGAGLGVVGGLYNFIRAAMKLGTETTGRQQQRTDEHHNRAEKP